MKTLTIAGLFICTAITSIAQTTEVRYYKGLPVMEEVPQQKAKYSITTTTNPDGTVITERKNLKQNLVETRQIMKGDEPIGIWLYLTGSGPAEMDYNFAVEYSDQACPPPFTLRNYFADEPALGYEAPKISTGEQFSEFVVKNLVYPIKAKREGIEGKVELIFDMTADGAIKNIRVKKGAHLVLDKEAMRIMRKINLATPPKVGGQPQDLCGTVMISFRLG